MRWPTRHLSWCEHKLTLSGWVGFRRPSRGSCLRSRRNPDPLVTPHPSKQSSTQKIYKSLHCVYFRSLHASPSRAPSGFPPSSVNSSEDRCISGNRDIVIESLDVLGRQFGICGWSILADVIYSGSYSFWQRWVPALRIAFLSHLFRLFRHDNYCMKRIRLLSWVLCERKVNSLSFLFSCILGTSMPLSPHREPRDASFPRSVIKSSSSTTS